MDTSANRRITWGPQSNQTQARQDLERAEGIITRGRGADSPAGAVGHKARFHCAYSIKDRSLAPEDIPDKKEKGDKRMSE